MNTRGGKSSGEADWSAGSPSQNDLGPGDQQDSCQ